MRTYRRAAHTVYELHYHFVFTTKYRKPVLRGEVAEEARDLIREICRGNDIEILAGNVRPDHVHLLVMVPPKVTISGFVGTIKGRTAIRVLNEFRKLKEKPYWGNHLWARGYCVDTVGLDSEMIRKYVKYQEGKERASEKPQY